MKCAMARRALRLVLLAASIAVSQPAAALSADALGRPQSAASLVLRALTKPADDANCSAARIEIMPTGAMVTVAWQAQGEFEIGDHVQVYVGHHLSGVANCRRFTGPGCDAALPGPASVHLGRCPLQDGSVTLPVPAGSFLVVHILLMSADGRPRGPHEHVMVHAPDFRLDGTDEVPARVSECGTAGNEQNFLELARQCERYGNLPEAATMFECALERASAAGRMSPHASVGLYEMAGRLYPPSSEEHAWRHAEALDAVGSLTDGVTSVAERWLAARTSPCTNRSRALAAQDLAPSGRRSRAASFVLDIHDVRSTDVSAEFDRLCLLDCLDTGMCFDTSFYYLEFSRHDNHYRLLKYLSNSLSLSHADPLIIDLGTHAGGSSAALGSNPRSTVISFDLEDQLFNQAATCGQGHADFKTAQPNVEYRVGDIMALDRALLLQADMIVLDTAHEGDWEELVYEYLCAHGFRGLLFLDDIHANVAMEMFWAAIVHHKYDLTRVGHAISGTGLVDFGGRLQVVGLGDE